MASQAGRGYSRSVAGNMKTGEKRRGKGGCWIRMYPYGDRCVFFLAGRRDRGTMVNGFCGVFGGQGFGWTKERPTQTRALIPPSK